MLSIALGISIFAFVSYLINLLILIRRKNSENHEAGV